MLSIAAIAKTFSLRTSANTKGKHQQQTIEYTEGSTGGKNVSAQSFTFREMAVATNNFSIENLVGEGGFGRVYKGYIPGTDKAVAVKLHDKSGMQGNKEFVSEVSMLSQIEHPNLVNLIGYCADGDQRILVYEYMAGGSLKNHLLDIASDRKPLDWYTRMKIAEGAAKGLEHLHEVNKPPIIYREFKASNILLDEDFNPKLSGFGLDKIDPNGDKDHALTRFMGTYGYCAPEYGMTGQLTTKSDVYSFGVVFLELISGRKAVDTTKPTDEQNLVTWAQPMFKDRKMFMQMADPLLEGKYPDKGLFQALAVAAMCLQDEPSTRPFISDIVIALGFLATPDEDPGSLRTESTIIRAMEEEAARVDQDEDHDKHNENTDQEKGEENEIQQEQGYIVESPEHDT